MKNKNFSQWLLIGLLWVPSFVQGEDWPQFLGPTADGKSTESGILKSWHQNGTKRNWDLRVGSGYSAPSIKGDSLVLFHRKGNEEIVECLNKSNGKTKWEYKYPSVFIDPFGYSNGPRCTPILTDDHCFTFGAEGVLLCLNIHTGKKIWEIKTQEKWKVPEAFFGVGSTPVLHKNKLFVMVGGQPNSGMVAFNIENGKVVWESIGQANWDKQAMIGWPGKRKYSWKGYEKVASYSSPVVAKVHGQDVLFGFMRQGIAGLNPETGDLLFDYWFRSRVQESVNAINPVVLNNQVFLSSCYYRQGSVLLDLNKNIEVSGEAWRGMNLEIHFTTPIVHNGYIYAFSGRNPPDASFRCVEWKSGDLMWEENHSLRTREDYSSKLGRGSAIYADGHLIVLGETGLLSLYKTQPKEAEKISSFKVEGMDYPSWTAPILSDRNVFLRSETHLISLDVAAQ